MLHCGWLWALTSDELTHDDPSDMESTESKVVSFTIPFLGFKSRYKDHYFWTCIQRQAMHILTIQPVDKVGSGAGGIW